MMLVVAPAERETNMASASEDEADNLRRRMSHSVGDDDAEAAGMSSSETDHRGGRRSKASSGHRSRKKSPGRNAVDGRQARAHASKVKPKGGVTRSRSTVDQEDKKARTTSGGRRNSASAGIAHIAQNADEEGSLRKKTSSSSRESKATKSGTSHSRRGRSTASTTSAKISESKGEKDAKNRRRRPSESHDFAEAKDGYARSDATATGTARNKDDQMSSTGSLPKSSDSSSNRKHRSKSRSRADHRETERSARSGRTEKSQRSDRSGRSSMKTPVQQESTLDSARPSTTKSSTSSSSEPKVSLRSSVKVASALVKFRKVLAMSKEATASSQTYRDGQEKQGHDRENARSVKDSASSSHRRGRGSSHHYRDGSRHSKHCTSSAHRRRNEHGENSSTRSKRRNRETSPSLKRSTKASSSTKEHAPPSPVEHDSGLVDADAFLKEALSNVGKKLSRSSATAKNEREEQDDAPVVTTTATTDGVSKSSTRESSSAIRMKSSAKVSTAMLKFQQALALSKSATKAAKTQQETQNKLLGEVHADKRSPDDYLPQASKQNKYAAATRAVSPVSTVDVEPTKASNDSPKVPGDLDLDCDSDIDSEIEIEDVNEDDEYSEVSTDSEDEDDAVVEPGTIMEVENTVVSTPVSIVSATTDSDFDSDVGDHSDVEIDSDDDLDSDEEFASAGNNGTSRSGGIDSDNEETKDKTSDGSDSDTDNNGSSVAIDTDDDVDSHGAGDEPVRLALAAEVVTGDNSDSKVAMYTDEDVASDGYGYGPKDRAAENVDSEILATPQSSSVDHVAAAALGQLAASKNCIVDPTTEQISARLHLARSLSFKGQPSPSLLENSSTDWHSSRDLTALSKGQNLGIPGLSPEGNKSANEDSEMAFSYLPTPIAKPEKGSLRDGDRHQGLSKQERSSSSRRLTNSSASDSNNPSRMDLKRRSSSRSMRKIKSVGEAPVTLDTARKLLGDESLGRRARASSRRRKPPSRSRSSCSQSKSDEEGSQRERRSKTTDRQKGERPKRSSSASRSRTLAGLSSLTQEATSSPKDNTREGRRSSSRRRIPNRTKSHDGTSPHRKSSRTNTGGNGERDIGERRSRKVASPPE